MDLLVLLVGDSGVGKTTLQKYLKKTHEIPWVLSSTTRSPREGEVNGIDYRFSTIYELEKLKKFNFVVQSTENKDTWYFTTMQDYANIKQRIATLAVVPSHINTLKKYMATNKPELKIITCFFDLSNEQIMNNLMSGDGLTEEQAQERLDRFSIKKDFQNLNIKPEINIDDDLFKTKDFGRLIFNRIATKYVDKIEVEERKIL